VYHVGDVFHVLLLLDRTFVFGLHTKTLKKILKTFKNLKTFLNLVFSPDLCTAHMDNYFDILFTETVTV